QSGVTVEALRHACPSPFRSVFELALFIPVQAKKTITLPRATGVGIPTLKVSYRCVDSCLVL
ncbi:MAG TPA: hypothetical protein PLD93_03060, partial [Synergistaceae bacterium]|nr:hypothetical protein [Synergistaceae bacterium]